MLGLAADVEQDRNDPGAGLDHLLAEGTHAGADGAERGVEAVPDVDADCQHPQSIERDQPPLLEAENNPLVRIDAAVVADGDGLGGELQQVEDHAAQDDDAAPNHGARREAALR